MWAASTGADAEDRAQRLQARVAARTLAQLGVDDGELFVEHRDQREHGLDVRVRRRRQHERAGPALAGNAEQAAAAARPPFVREQCVQALRETHPVLGERATQAGAVA
jgi:hypothetical protein